jgi:hypothetical protein
MWIQAVDIWSGKARPTAVAQGGRDDARKTISQHRS